MKRAFADLTLGRRELEAKILELIKAYEMESGWMITQLEFYSTGGRVISEAVPMATKITS